MEIEFKPGRKYKITQPYNKDTIGDVSRGASGKVERGTGQTATYTHVYDTDHLHFFEDARGRMESFQRKRIGIDIFAKEV